MAGSLCNRVSLLIMYSLIHLYEKCGKRTASASEKNQHSQLMLIARAVVVCVSVDFRM